jgi:NADH:ubiquinone oxidoreductase subunit H
MWDLKLYLIDFFFYFNFLFYDFFLKFLNFFDPFFQNGFFLNTSKVVYQFPQNMVFFFAIKFSLCIALLVLIRGGTPRYRYDYLTKLGWLKFLGFIIAVFLTSVLFFFFILKIKKNEKWNLNNYITY